MSRAPVMVIRAEPGATRTAARLAERGYAPIIEPVQEVVAIAVPPPRLRSGEGIIVTSPNGAARLPELITDKTRQIWCVGDVTAGIVREHGFVNIYSARGDAEALAAMIERECPPGPLLHLAGAEAGAWLIERLGQNGFDARAVSIYHMRTSSASRAGEILLHSWRSRDGRALLAVLVHSAGAATALAEMVSASVGHVAAIAISSAAAMPVLGVFDMVLVAPEPNEQAMLKELDKR